MVPKGPSELKGTELLVPSCNGEQQMGLQTDTGRQCSPPVQAGDFL